jgi:hypothetical protein
MRIAEPTDPTGAPHVGKGMSKRSLPILDLDNIDVATPCTANWDAMTVVGAAVRHCGACEKNVYNVSGMTRQSATELLLENEGNICVRFVKRHDGTLITNDCPVGVALWRKRARRAAMAVSAMATAVVAFAVSSGVWSKRMACTATTPVDTATETSVETPPQPPIVGVLLPPEPPEPPTPRPLMGAPKPPRQPPAPHPTFAPKMGRVAPRTH